MHTGGAAACRTANVRPAIVSEPARPPPVFAATLNPTVPFPDPLLPEVIVSQPALLAAVQAHPAVVDTAIEVPAPPAALNDCATGSIEYEQLAAWFSVKVWPAIVSVPVRALPEFDATLKVTVPLPVPLLPDVIVSQPALLAAVHGHPDAADTATELPAPPLLPIDCVDGLIE